MAIYSKKLSLKVLKEKGISSKIKVPVSTEYEYQFQSTSVVLTFVLLRIKLFIHVAVCRWFCASDLSEGYVLPSALGFKQFSCIA